MHLNRRFQNLERPGVNSDGPKPSFLVETAYITFRLVKTHQPVDSRDGLERRINGGIHFGSGRARDLDLHERAEQRPRATNSIGGGCHRLPILSAPPRCAASMTRSPPRYF